MRIYNVLNALFYSQYLPTTFKIFPKFYFSNIMLSSYQYINHNCLCICLGNFHTELKSFYIMYSFIVIK